MYFYQFGLQLWLNCNHHWIWMTTSGLTFFPQDFMKISHLHIFREIRTEAILYMDLNPLYYSKKNIYMHFKKGLILLICEF